MNVFIRIVYYFAGFLNSWNEDEKISFCTLFGLIVAEYIMILLKIPDFAIVGAGFGVLLAVLIREIKSPLQVTEN